MSEKDPVLSRSCALVVTGLLSGEDERFLDDARARVMFAPFRR